MALPATEAFTGATANLADPPWKLLNVVGREVKKDGAGNGTPVNATGGDCIVTWDSDTFANDQYSQYVAKYSGSAGQYVYLVARTTGVYATGAWYWFWSDGGSDTALLKVTTGQSSAVAVSTANATTFTSGDVFRLICNGTAISVTKNGTPILSATDSAVTTGSAGMGGSQGATGVLFDDWIADNVATTSLPPGLGPAGEMEMATQSAISAMMR